MTINYTALGSGYYKVYVDGVEISKHTAEREAAESAVNAQLTNPSSTVTYVHEYTVKVSSMTTTPPTTPVQTIQGIFLPEDFGAKADGNTDCSAAIIAADAAASVAGGIVQFGAGRYACSSPVIGCQSDMVHWRGVGHATILETFASGAIGFDFANTNGTPIRNMKLSDMWFKGGNGENLILRTSYALDGRLVGVRISDSSNIGAIFRRPQNMVMDWCEIRDNASWGVQFKPMPNGSGQTSRILHSTFFNNGAVNGDAGGLDIDDGAEHIVAWSQFESHNTTSQTQAIRDTTARTNVFGNTFENNSVFMHLGNGTKTSRRLKFLRNNVIDGAFHAENYRNFLVEGNSFGDNLNRWYAIFGADEGNSLSIWRNNYEDPCGVDNGRFTSSAQVGKIQIEGSWDQTTNGRLKVFADGDTSPSVAGGFYYETANTSLTKITKFDDWYPGQTVFVRIGDTNTVIVRNVNTIETSTGADVRPQKGDVLVFTIVRREPEPGSPAHKAYLTGFIPSNQIQSYTAGTFDELYQVAPGIWVPCTRHPNS